MKKMKQHYCAHMWPNWHGASQQLSKTASAEPSGKWGCTLPSLDTPSGNLSSPSSEVDKFHPACVIWRFISTFFGTRLLGICLQQVWFLPLQGKMIFYGTFLISALVVASSTLIWLRKSQQVKHFGIHLHCSFDQEVLTICDIDYWSLMCMSSGMTIRLPKGEDIVQHYNLTILSSLDELYTYCFNIL